jgi:branched-chain amino acid transport system substrate-binding protein
MTSPGKGATLQPGGGRSPVRLIQSRQKLPEENAMKNKLLAGIALGVGLALAGAANAQIKVGVAGPITGPNAAFGAQLKNGAEQAVEDINAAGGVNGQKLTLSIGDDVSDPKQGVSVANKFAAEGVKWVVGHFNSGVSIPTSDIYEESGIIQISPASTNPKFTDSGKWNTFRTCGRDDQQGLVAGSYLADKFKGKNVAIVHDKTPYGKGLADETRKTMNAKGLKDVVYEGVNPGEKDYSALVSKLKGANVDVVYFGGLHTEAGLIIRQMRDQGLAAPLMSGDGIVSSEFTAIAGPGAEGTLMTFAPDPRKNPAAKDVVAKFRAKNYEPEAYTLYSYAAVQVLAQAAAEAKSTDSKKIAETIRSGKPFKTVIGDLSFDKKGDITRPDYVVYVWKKGANGQIDYAGNELTQ